MGVRISPYDIRDYKVSSFTTSEFPTAFMLDFPKIKDQGAINSCVAHALSYVIEHFNKLQEHNDVQFSTGFIYGYRPDGYYQGYGMYIRDALKTIQKFGDVPLDDFPLNCEVPTAKNELDKKFEGLKGKAFPNRISTYFTLSTDDDIKSCLMNENYVVVSIPWFSDTKVLSNSVLSSSMKEDRPGYHCVVILGWNPLGWVIANSWGPDWGMQGGAILPYNWPIREKWGVTDNITSVTIEKLPSNKLLNIIYKILNAIINVFRRKK